MRCSCCDQWVTWIFTLRSSSGDSGALSHREEQPKPKEGAHCLEEALWDQCMWLPSLGLLGWCFRNSGLPNGHLQIVFSVLLGICYCHSSFCVIIPVKQWPFPDYLLKKDYRKAVHLKKNKQLAHGFWSPMPEGNISVSFLCSSIKSCP